MLYILDTRFNFLLKRDEKYEARIHLKGVGIIEPVSKISKFRCSKIDLRLQHSQIWKICQKTKLKPFSLQNEGNLLSKLNHREQEQDIALTRNQQNCHFDILSFLIVEYPVHLCVYFQLYYGSIDRNNGIKSGKYFNGQIQPRI